MATQVLPMIPPHFLPDSSSYNPEMYTEFPGYADFPTSDFQPYQFDSQGRQHYLAPTSAQPSEVQFRRPSSHSPHAQMHTIPRSDRTPIQHHLSSVSRARSQSRTEMLYAYAADQSQIQATPPQPPPPHIAADIFAPPSGPNTPSMYSMQDFSMPPDGGAYGDPHNYLSTSASTHQDSLLPQYAYQQGENMTDFYTASRTTSHGGIESTSNQDQQDPVYLQSSASQGSPNLSPLAAAVPTFAHMSIPLESTPGEVKAMVARPKPQCWDHGCNGRQFSTFSNLLRHQRERSGSAQKSVCPHCGTEFTRTTARNGHLSGGKCKGKSDQDLSRRSSASGNGREDN